VFDLCVADYLFFVFVFVEGESAWDVSFVWDYGDAGVEARTGRCEDVV